jgi:hypothetical protein
MATIIVEGFPRSGTTFLYDLIRLGFPSCEVIYSEHTASKLDLDNVIVVIRDPYKSIFSWKNYIGKDENVSDIAKWYVRYHTKVLDNIDGLTVIDFNEMITDPVRVLENVSNRINIDYQLVDIDSIRKNETAFDYTSFVTKDTKEAYQIYKQIIKKI